MAAGAMVGRAGFEPARARIQTGVE